MTLKQKVHQHYLQMVYDNIRLLQQDLADLKESGANESRYRRNNRDGIVTSISVRKSINRFESTRYSRLQQQKLLY
jgi:hypothetical protein